MKTYGQIIRDAVRRKWHTNEEKEAWYTKFSAARRVRTRKLSEAQGHRCATCQGETWLTDQERVARKLLKYQLATLEHIKPQVDGGTDHFYNVVMTCSRCNHRRATMDIYVFFDLLQDPETRAKVFRTRSQVDAEARRRKELRKAEKHPDKMERAAFRLAWTELFFPGFLASYEAIHHAAE